MNQLFIMDPLEKVNPATDTTYALMRAAARRGHSLHFAEARDLSLVGGTPHVSSREVELLPPGEGPLFRWRGEASFRDVSSFPLVWLRTDPPFDAAYLEATWILDRVDRSRCRVINDPVGIRGANEKLYALHFPELCPPTLVSSDRGLLRRFVEEHGEVVFKPPEGHAGSGILFAHSKMRGLGALIEVATRDGMRTEVQAYLPASTQGDKRILLLDGEPLGAVLRVHGPGEERNNLHLGGTAAKTSLDDDDWRIVRTVAPRLRQDGLVFVGLDVIGGKLTEVNVTSPTGIQELETLDGPGGCDRVIEWTERNAPA